MQKHILEKIKIDLNPLLEINFRVLDPLNRGSDFYRKNDDLGFDEKSNFLRLLTEERILTILNEGKDVLNIKYKDYLFISRIMSCIIYADSDDGYFWEKLAGLNIDGLCKILCDRFPEKADWENLSKNTKKNLNI